jgi:hypothetical protein
MEAFFAPSPQYIGDFVNNVDEIDLTEGSCAGEILLHRGFTWEDFYSVANGKIVWISPGVYFYCSLIGSSDQTVYECFLNVSGGPESDGDEEDRDVFRVLVYASSIASASIACDILLQLLTTCESRKITLTSYNDSHVFPVSGLAFSHFLIHSNHSLKVLSLDSLLLDACHCHAIDASTRTDLQIDLNSDLGVTELGENIILESIQQNRGPTGLYRVRLDASRLANALRSNSRVSSISPCWDSKDSLAFFQALAENEGLVKLDLTNSFHISDENWDVLWQSISRHPRLEILDVRDLTIPGLTAAQKTRRSQAIVDALRVNTVLHTIELFQNDCDLDMWDNVIYPRLLVDRYRPRVAAIVEERGT